MWMGNKQWKKLPVYITENEFCDLLSATPQRRHRVAFLMAWGSGLRISEVTNLQRADINLIDKTIRVNQGKGKQDRIVPIPKGFRTEFAKFIPFKFENRSLQKAFVRAAIKCGIKTKKPNVRFHSLRHGFAVACLKKNISLRSIQLMLGHASISQTSVYLQLSPDDVMNEYQNKF